MTTMKRLRITLLAGAIGFIGIETFERPSLPGVSGIISTAEARAGRPRTPVSVAGVARRSVRRCAAGAYC